MDSLQTLPQTFIYKLSDLPGLVKQIFPLLHQYKVIALHGELGAGKTTFTAALCRLLNTKEKADSPTFSLVNQYNFIDVNGVEQIIYHTDWYRLKNEEEAQMAGIEDTLNSNYFLCFVEWSENAPGLLPDKILHLFFSLGEVQDQRILKITENK